MFHLVKKELKCYRFSFPNSLITKDFILENLQNDNIEEIQKILEIKDKIKYIKLDKNFMQDNYEEIVRKWYIRYRQPFLVSLTQRYKDLRWEDAENLYQDTFIAIQKNLMAGNIREETSWSSYIFKIGMNMANKHARHAGITDSTDYDSYEEENQKQTAMKVQNILISLPNTEHSFYDDPDVLSVLNEELEHTPEPCNTIVRLFYYGQKKMTEIAEIVGFKNADTTKAKKNQCMKSLIERVKRSMKMLDII